MEQALRYELEWVRLGAARLSRGLARRLAPGAVRLAPVEVERPGAEWVRVRPRLAGICGSDLAVLTGHSSSYLAPLTGFPIHLGHEVVASVDDEGGPWPRGTRVVVRPTLGCAARNLPPCAACRDGVPDLCRRRSDPGLGAGTMIGYHGRLPGGWSTMLWAPARQLYPVPDDVPDTVAVLTEPAAIALAAVRQIDWSGVRRTLVLGAGTVGLLTLWALKVEGVGGTVGTVARRAHQARLAERLGAMVLSPEDLMDWTGGPAELRMPGADPYYPSGADVVIDTVGSRQSLRQALGVTTPGGQLLMIGGIGPAALDLAPLWTRRLRVFGAWGYGSDEDQLFSGALERLAGGGARDPVREFVTHQAPLTEWPRAIATALNPDVPRVKVTLVPGPGN